MYGIWKLYVEIYSNYLVRTKVMTDRHTDRQADKGDSKRAHISTKWLSLGVNIFTQSKRQAEWQNYRQWYRNQQLQIVLFIYDNKYVILIFWFPYYMNTRRWPSADPEGGGGTGGPEPPWDLSEVGSCVEAWWVGGVGVQRLFSPNYKQFFSGSLRSPVLYK